MKLTSFFIFFCPIFIVITSFLQMRKIKQNVNVVQPMVQPMIQPNNQVGMQIQPMYQNINPNENYPSNVPQVVDNLYNEPNNDISYEYQ